MATSKFQIYPHGMHAASLSHDMTRQTSEAACPLRTAHAHAGPSLKPMCQSRPLNKAVGRRLANH